MILKETTPFSRVTGHTSLFNAVEKGVTITVISDLNDSLNIARTLALYPDFVSASTPVGSPPRRNAHLQSTSIQVREHENLVRKMVLDNDWKQCFLGVETIEDFGQSFFATTTHNSPSL